MHGLTRPDIARERQAPGSGATPLSALTITGIPLKSLIMALPFTSR
jgi:hypothetical protein